MRPEITHNSYQAQEGDRPFADLNQRLNRLERPDLKSDFEDFSKIDLKSSRSVLHWMSNVIRKSEDIRSHAYNSLYLESEECHKILNSLEQIDTEWNHHRKAIHEPEYDLRYIASKSLLTDVLQTHKPLLKKKDNPNFDKFLIELGDFRDEGVNKHSFLKRIVNDGSKAVEEIIMENGNQPLSQGDWIKAAYKVLELESFIENDRYQIEVTTKPTNKGEKSGIYQLPVKEAAQILSTEQKIDELRGKYNDSVDTSFNRSITKKIKSLQNKKRSIVDSSEISSIDQIINRLESKIRNQNIARELRSLRNKRARIFTKLGITSSFRNPLSYGYTNPEEEPRYYSIHTSEEAEKIRKAVVNELKHMKSLDKLTDAFTLRDRLIEVMTGGVDNAVLNVWPEKNEPYTEERKKYSNSQFRQRYLKHLLRGFEDLFHDGTRSIKAFGDKQISLNAPAGTDFTAGRQSPIKEIKKQNGEVIEVHQPVFTDFDPSKFERNYKPHEIHTQDDDSDDAIVGADINLSDAKDEYLTRAIQGGNLDLDTNMYNPEYLLENMDLRKNSVYGIEFRDFNMDVFEKEKIRKLAQEFIQAWQNESMSVQLTFNPDTDDFTRITITDYKGDEHMFPFKLFMQAIGGRNIYETTGISHTDKGLKFDKKIIKRQVGQLEIGPENTQSEINHFFQHLNIDGKNHHDLEVGIEADTVNVVNREFYGERIKDEVNTIKVNQFLDIWKTKQFPLRLLRDSKVNRFKEVTIADPAGNEVTLPYHSFMRAISARIIRDEHDKAIGQSVDELELKENSNNEGINGFFRHLSINNRHNSNVNVEVVESELTKTFAKTGRPGNKNNNSKSLEPEIIKPKSTIASTKRTDSVIFQEPKFVDPKTEVANNKTEVKTMNIEVDFKRPETFNNPKIGLWQQDFFDDFMSEYNRETEQREIELQLNKEGTGFLWIRTKNADGKIFSTYFSWFMQSINSKPEYRTVDNRIITVNPVGNEEIGPHMNEDQLAAVFQTFKINKITLNNPKLKQRFIESGTIHKNVNVKIEPWKDLSPDRDTKVIAVGLNTLKKVDAESI